MARPKKVKQEVETPLVEEPIEEKAPLVEEPIEEKAPLVEEPIEEKAPKTIDDINGKTVTLQEAKKATKEKVKTLKEIKKQAKKHPAMNDKVGTYVDKSTNFLNMFHRD